MPSYYPTQASHYSHHDGQPVVYTSSHRSHHSHHVPYPSSGSQQYYSQPTYGGNDVVYVPTHASSHGHHSHYTQSPQVVYTTTSSHGHGHRHHRDSPRYYSTRSSSHGYGHLTLGERIRRFFGFGPKRHHYKRKSRTSSWGFLGRSRRRRYMDARTGAEVDRHGRPVYRV